MHWPMEELMNLDHRERRRWCEEVSAINRKIGDNKPKPVEFR